MGNNRGVGWSRPGEVLFLHVCSHVAQLFWPGLYKDFATVFLQYEVEVRKVVVVCQIRGPCCHVKL